MHSSAKGLQTSLETSYCFVAGTLITTADGFKPIEQIQTGDLVLSENENTGEVAYKRVTKTFVNETTELIHVHAGGETISATPAHPFYVDGFGWTLAGNLRAGDVLVLVNGEKLVVEWVDHELLESPVHVYNFEVEDFHTYFVGENSVLVHNWCGEEVKSISNGTKTPAERAKEKGYDGLTTTPNGGVSFQGSDFVHKNVNGNETIVSIKMTGSRSRDYTAAFNEAKIPRSQRRALMKEYTWHHVDDFDPVTNKTTMQLVLKEAHVATYPHRGSVAQYEKYYNVKYK